MKDGKMLSKKIGLLTIHDTLNYGSLLQTYALYQAIQSMNLDVELIDYKCEKIRKRESTFELRDNLNLQGIVKYLLWHKALKEKYLAFWKFIKCHMKISDPYNKYNISNTNSLYDMFVVGSDIVWGTNITGHDFTYFLDFANKCKRKIAFSSSVGTKWSQEDCKQITTLLNRFDEISVREQLASDWIREVTGREVKVTCDPTMLWATEFWDKIIDESILPPRKYVLIYLTTSDKQNIEDAKKYANEHNWDVLFINFYKPFKGVHNIKPVSIEQWIALIKNAEIIFSASYHGLLFSLYFHRPVFFYNRGEKSRMISLAEELKIKHREGNAKNLENNNPIDFTYVDEKMREKRDYSWEVLKESLA